MQLEPCNAFWVIGTNVRLAVFRNMNHGPASERYDLFIRCTGRELVKLCEETDWPLLNRVALEVDLYYSKKGRSPSLRSVKRMIDETLHNRD